MPASCGALSRPMPRDAPVSTTTLPRIGLLSEDEEEAAVLDRVDDRAGALRGQGGAAPAPAEAAVGAGVLGAHVPGAVHHDVARLREVVDAGLEAAQLERIAVAAGVGAAGQVET